MDRTVRLAPLDREAKPELADLFDRAEAKSGHVANAFLVLARRPTYLRLIFETREALYEATTVDKEILDLVGTMASVVAGCEYSSTHGNNRISAHGKEGEQKARQILEFESSDDFTPAEKAALRVARGASTVPNSVTDEEFADLRRYFSEEEIVDIVYRICNTGWMNRWNTTMGTPLE